MWDFLYFLYIITALHQFGQMPVCENLLNSKSISDYEVDALLLFFLYLSNVGPVLEGKTIEDFRCMPFKAVFSVS